MNATHKIYISKLSIGVTLLSKTKTSGSIEKNKSWSGYSG